MMLCHKILNGVSIISIVQILSPQQYRIIQQTTPTHCHRQRRRACCCEVFLISGVYYTEGNPISCHLPSSSAYSLLGWSQLDLAVVTTTTADWSPFRGIFFDTQSPPTSPPPGCPSIHVFQNPSIISLLTTTPTATTTIKRHI